MLKKHLFLIMGLLTFLTGCSNDDNSSTLDNPRRDITLSRAEEQMAEECNDFAFRLFKQIDKSETGNWIVSPISLSMNLGMLTNGAAGNTLQELQKTLGFDNCSKEEMNTYFNKLATELLKLDKTTQLELANSIWISDKFEVKTPFVTVNETMYGAKVSTLDLTSPDAPTTINKWCSDRTHNTIQKILEKCPEKICLLNALYFKGSWEKKFKEANTKDDTFQNADGTVSTVKMMSQTGAKSYPYVENEHFRIAELSYGNKAFSMVILLPADNKTLDESLEALTFSNWNSWNAELHDEPLYLQLPRFGLSYNRNLIEDMQKLGVKDAFTMSADFSGISDSELYFDLLKQHTYLSIDENGTEATVVTGSGMIGAAPSKTFRADRPFAFLIKEQSTGTILFMGKIEVL